MIRKDVLLKQAEWQGKIFFDDKFFRIMKRMKKRPNDQQMRAILAEYIEKSLKICRRSRRARGKFFAEACWHATTKKTKVAPIYTFLEIFFFEIIMETEQEEIDAQFGEENLFTQVTGGCHADAN